MAYEHVIIDGHNLAVKCARAPGLDALSSGEQRTGEVYGFLRLLGSLKRRYQGARFTVVWDGKNDKRKAIFGGYKASRGERRDDFSIVFLKEALPLLGVRQCSSYEDEADDVIGKLAREPAYGERTIVVSTDRDLVQLVDDKTIVLSLAPDPKKKETVFTKEQVEKTYGVSPDKTVDVRAIAGDVSDEIQGIERIGVKQAAKIIRRYSSIEALFENDMKALTRLQRKRLGEGKEIVLRNKLLMKLLTPGVVTFIQERADRRSAEQALALLKIRPNILEPFFPKQSCFA